jgi:hypothetical protein
MLKHRAKPGLDSAPASAKLAYAQGTAMNALDDAKAQFQTQFRAEKSKVASSLDAIIGSRPALAVSAALTLAFGACLWFWPGQLPPVGGFSLAAVGLPPLDFGMAGQAAQDAAAAAQRQGASGYVQGFLDEHPGLIPYINGAAFALSAAFMAWTIWLLRKRAK